MATKPRTICRRPGNQIYCETNFKFSWYTDEFRPTEGASIFHPSIQRQQFEFPISAQNELWTNKCRKHQKETSKDIDCGRRRIQYQRDIHIAGNNIENQYRVDLWTCHKWSGSHSEDQRRYQHEWWWAVQLQLDTDGLRNASDEWIWNYGQDKACALSAWCSPTNYCRSDPPHWVQARSESDRQWNEHGHVKTMQRQRIENSCGYAWVYTLRSAGWNAPSWREGRQSEFAESEVKVMVSWCFNFIYFVI